MLERFKYSEAPKCHYEKKRNRLTPRHRIQNHLNIRQEVIFCVSLCLVGGELAGVVVGCLI